MRNSTDLKQLLASKGQDFRVWTRWGRVGAYGQTKILPGGTFAGAFNAFEAKFKEKTGHKWADRLKPPKKGKYTLLERSYEPETSDVEGEVAQSIESPAGAKSRPAQSALAAPVQDLMRLIFNKDFIQEVMADMNYDAQKLPLGRLSKRTLAQGYAALKSLSDVLRDPSVYGGTDSEAYEEAIYECTNTYYTNIPHNVGFGKLPLIKDDRMLKKEIELLQSLTDMSVTDEIMTEARTSPGSLHPLDVQFKGLNLDELSPVDRQSDEFQDLEQYLLKTRGSTHAIKYSKVEAIFRVERNGEFERFKKKYGNLQADRRLLWHGSRTTNFGGILSQGLRVAPPEAPFSGYVSLDSFIQAACVQ